MDDAPYRIERLSYCTSVREALFLLRRRRLLPRPVASQRFIPDVAVQRSGRRVAANGAWVRWEYCPRN
jgi:hypothetical protein